MGIPPVRGVPICVFRGSMAAVTKLSSIISAKELTGSRVIGGKKGVKTIGKVRYFVFHPTKKACVGFMVRRPDAALMFKRKDLFVALDGYEFEDGRIVVPHDDKDAVDAGACKRLGIDLDSCIIWQGMPIISQSGEELGYVEDVQFKRASGKVVSITPHASATSKALIGTLTIPSEYVKGFRTGVGTELTITEGEGEEERSVRGAIVVDNEALRIDTEGGIAEKAGQSTAIAAEKVRQAKEQAKPAVDAAAKATGDAVNKGAYVTGRQIGRAKGMFSAFKDEYDKAVADTPKSTKKNK